MGRLLGELKEYTGDIEYAHDWQTKEERLLVQAQKVIERYEKVIHELENTNNCVHVTGKGSGGTVRNKMQREFEANIEQSIYLGMHGWVEEYPIQVTGKEDIEDILKEFKNKKVVMTINEK